MRPWVVRERWGGACRSPALRAKKRLGCPGCGCLLLRGGWCQSLCSWRPFSLAWVSAGAGGERMIARRAGLLRGTCWSSVGGSRPCPRWRVGTIPLTPPGTGWNAGPAGRVVRGMAGFRGRKQPFGAEPGGGVRNREKGASCLSAASSCPAGCAARRPGSSQRQGCPFFWFFSLGRQRKERHPAGGRWHSGGAGAPWSPFPRWSVGTIKKRI